MERVGGNETFWRGLWGACAAWTAVVLAFAIGGCACWAPKPEAGRPIQYGSRVEQVLRVPMPKVYAATSEVLQQQRLPVLEERSDVLSARLKSRFPDGTAVTVELEALGDVHTRAIVTVTLKEQQHRASGLLQQIAERAVQ